MDLRFGILQLRRPPNISSPLWFTSGFDSSRLPLLTTFLVCFVPPTLQGRARMAEKFSLYVRGFSSSSPRESEVWLVKLRC